MEASLSGKIQAVYGGCQFLSPDSRATSCKSALRPMPWLDSSEDIPMDVSTPPLFRKAYAYPTVEPSFSTMKINRSPVLVSRSTQSRKPLHDGGASNPVQITFF